MRRETPDGIAPRAGSAAEAVNEDGDAVLRARPRGGQRRCENHRESGGARVVDHGYLRSRRMFENVVSDTARSPVSFETTVSECSDVLTTAWLGAAP